MKGIVDQRAVEERAAEGFAGRQKTAEEILLKAAEVERRHESARPAPSREPRLARPWSRDTAAMAIEQADDADRVELVQRICADMAADGEPLEMRIAVRAHVNTVRESERYARAAGREGS